MIRPEIILCVCEADEKALQEVLAGIEEEGVLYQVIKEDERSSGHALGQRAALRSQLETGISIRGKEVQLWIKKVRNAPLLITRAHYRKLGQNAAR